MEHFDYPDLKSIQKVLCIKLRHYGDLLLSWPIFSILKSRMPHATIDAYIFKDAFEILEGHPSIDHFHFCDRKWKKLNFFSQHLKEGHLLWQIRQQNYDMIINLTEGDRGALAGYLSGAKIRVGFLPQKKRGFLFKAHTITHPVTYCPTPRHAVERNCDALRRIGIFPKESEKEIHFSLQKQPHQRISLSPYILIHPTSERIFKSPPFRFFIQLIHILQKRGLRIVITCGSHPIEKQFCESILQQTNDVAHEIGNTTIKELGQLIASAAAVITVDTFTQHLASALKVPTVALFGPSSEIEWGPWRNPHSKVMAANFSCRPCGLQGCGMSYNSDCMAHLSPQETANALFSLLTT